MDRNSDESERLVDEYRRRNLQSLDLLLEKVQKLEVTIAIVNTKLGFIGAACGIAGACGVEFVKHLMK